MLHQLRIAEISKFGCEEESKKTWFNKDAWVAYHRQLIADGSPVTKKKLMTQVYAAVFEIPSFIVS